MRLAQERENLTKLWPWPNYHRVFVGCVTVADGDRIIDCKIFLGRCRRTKRPAMRIMALSGKKEINLFRKFEENEYMLAEQMGNNIENVGKIPKDDLYILGFEGR